MNLKFSNAKVHRTKLIYSKSNLEFDNQGNGDEILKTMMFLRNHMEGKFPGGQNA
jgi:hypothetical protein